MQYVRLKRDADFSGTLTFSRAPDGELAFEDGVAAVADDVDVEWLTTRYPNLVPADSAPDANGGGDDSDADSESDEADADADESEADPLADADYSDLRQMAGEYDDVKGNWPEDKLRAALREKEA